jgi:hypothetical protein
MFVSALSTENDILVKQLGFRLCSRCPSNLESNTCFGIDLS